MKRVALAALYVGSVVAANWLTQRFGVVPLVGGLSVVAGTWAVGVAILTRNLGQDALGRVWIISLMAAGCLLSWWLASPALAGASAAAFAVSESADMLVYSELKERGRFMALAAAGMVGAVVDSCAFLFLAGFPLSASVVGGQVLVKAGVSVIAATSLARRRVAA